MLRNTTIAILTAGCLISTAWASEPATGIRSLLAGIDTVPPKAKFIESSDDPVKALLSIVSDPSERGYLRLRAVGFLGYFHRDKRVWPGMADLVKKGHPDIRVMAAKTVAHAFGPLRPQQVIQLLKPMLSEKSLKLRQAAVFALSGIKQKGADVIAGLLQGELKRASGSYRHLLEKALKRRRGIR
jgi:HEAT repeat protein